MSHTDAHDRLDDISIHHKPHVPQITSVFKPSHNMAAVAASRSTERGQAAVKCSRKSAMLGSAGWRLAWPPTAVSSRSTDMTDRIVPLKDTAQKPVNNTSCDSMALSTDTDGTRSQKPWKRAPWLIIFFDDRAADGRKHTAKMRGLEISRKYACLRSALFLV